MVLEFILYLYAFWNLMYFFLGFSNNPIARRVRSMPSDFFLLTTRFVCDPRRIDSPGCGANYQGTDPRILEQLPRFVQAAFPGKIILINSGIYW